MKLHHLLTSHTKINSKWVKNVNVRPKTIKILEENIGSKILVIACRNISYWIHIPKEGKQKKKISKWDYIKLKGFAQQGNHQQNKKITHRRGEHIHWYI